MTIAKKLLVAEDDRALGSLLVRAMMADGHEVELVCDGDAAVAVFSHRMPDLAIIDLGLPKLNGSEVLKSLRRISSDTPALILTGVADLDSRLQCFNLGADDCLLKPFALRELRARCNALLRRHTVTITMLRHEDVEMNRLDHSVRRAGAEVALTNKEYELLECLMLNQGKCVSRADLIEQVWKSEAGGKTNTNVVDVYINYLRRKLQNLGAPSLISTVRGEGYKIGNLTSAGAQTRIEA